MATARYLIGDTRKRLAEIPDGSVDLVLTSPPFLALRSYLPDDHPDKALEIGSEATPADFLDVLLDLTEDWARVLAPHGSIVVELGDTYAGSGSPGGDYAEGGMREGQPRTTYSGRRKAGDTVGERFERHEHGKYDRVVAGDHPGRRAPIPNLHDKTQPGGDGWPLDKSLCGIPQLFELSLIYGRNMLRPERLTEPWRVRNLVAWCRPNPPVGALSDKVRPATSYLTVATKSRTRWFDLDAVRTPTDRFDRGGLRKGSIHGTDETRALAGETAQVAGSNPAGAPPLDHWWHDDEFDQDAWLISTEPYRGSHYATWPTALLTKPVEAMCPRQVCTVCGEPSRRITKTEQVQTRKGNGRKEYPARQSMMENCDERTVAAVTTLGWTDCGHDAWRAGVVLDPFAGTGTTLAVATGHGRDAIGIDLDERNADLALERVGPMFLTVER